MCRNSEALVGVIARFAWNIGAIVCGHGHRTVFAAIAGVPAVMCPSRCPANPLLLDGTGQAGATDAPGLLVHLVRDNRINTHAISLAQRVAPRGFPITPSPRSLNLSHELVTPPIALARDRPSIGQVQRLK